MFYYSGHGSQEQAPEEFWHVEPDRLDETLVCFDSRMAGCWDLADKELGKLVDEVAANAGHVVVILDCCHSGSGTRGEVETVRRAPIDLRPRPLDTFLPGVLTVAESMSPRSVGSGAGWYAGTRGAMSSLRRVAMIRRPRSIPVMVGDEGLFPISSSIRLRLREPT